MAELPRVAPVEQEFPRPRVDSVEEKVSGLLSSGSVPRLEGKRVAVAVGSRGIARLAEVVGCVTAELRKRNARPFVFPAMGSHGGATSSGQSEILARYGVTEERLGVPVVSSLDTVSLGETPDGVGVFMDRGAFESDGVILINRVKPHTDFRGKMESGLMKMMVIGLGKVDGAGAFHSATMRLPHERLLETVARKVLEAEKVLFGVAILENAYHELADLEIVPASAIPAREPELLARARELMPSLPVDRLDVLVIDRIGKDISGSGMDPNITGRRFRINARWQESPEITRIVVLDLTDHSGGNAVGVGLADFASRRVIDKMDRQVTYLNAMTSRNTVTAQIPLYFDTDRETLEKASLSLGDGVRPENVRLIRIRDTLSLSRVEVSEALLPELRNHPRIKRIGEPREIRFSADGSLPESSW